MLQTATATDVVIKVNKIIRKITIDVSITVRVYDQANDSALDPTVNGIVDPTGWGGARTTAVMNQWST